MQTKFWKNLTLAVATLAATALIAGAGSANVIKTYDWTQPLETEWILNDSGPAVGCSMTIIDNWNPPMLRWYAIWANGDARIETNAGLPISDFHNIAVQYQMSGSAAGSYGANFMIYLAASFNGTDYFPLFQNKGIPVEQDYTYTYSGTPLFVDGGGPGAPATGGNYTRTITLDDSITAGHSAIWLKLHCIEDSPNQPLDAYNQNSLIFSPITVSGDEAPSPISGQVVLQDFSTENYWMMAVGLELSQNGAVVQKLTAELDENGNFTTAPVARGTYDISIKAGSFLRQVFPGVAVNGPTMLPSVSLINGDIDGDNEVTSTDLSILGLNLGLAGD